MATLTTALHDCTVIAIEAYDIDILNWSDDYATSFDPKVLEAAQQTISDCTPEERRALRTGGMQSSLVHANVAERLYQLGATAVDPGLVATLIIEMYRAVAL